MPHLKRIVYIACNYILHYLYNFVKFRQIPPLNDSSVVSITIPFLSTKRPESLCGYSLLGEEWTLFFFGLFIKEILFPVISLKSFPVV